MAHPIKELIYYYTDSEGYYSMENDEEHTWTVEKWLQWGVPTVGFLKDQNFYSIVRITYNDSSTRYIERKYEYCGELKKLDNTHLMFMLKCS